MVMYGSDVDKKNIELAKLLFHLRSHIDVHRIIGLNALALPEKIISPALFGYIQMLSMESMAMHLCKVFESPKKYELYSIHGIIMSIKDITICDRQRHGIETFGRKYNNTESLTNVREYLQDTFDGFYKNQSGDLDRLKTFRDKIGAHGEYGTNIDSLPSHDAVERLFDFAKDFYEVISRFIVGTGPANFNRKVGADLIRLMACLGVRNPVFDFEGEE